MNRFSLTTAVSLLMFISCSVLAGPAENKRLIEALQTQLAPEENQASLTRLKGTEAEILQDNQRKLKGRIYTAVMGALRNGAVPDESFDKDGSSALVLAAKMDHRPVIDILLANHANINAFNPDMTPAAFEGLSALVHRLLFSEEPISQKKDSFSTQGIDLLEFYRKRGADLSLAGEGGATVLMAAIWFPDIAVLKYLIEEVGLKKLVNQAGEEGETTLMFAAQGRRLEALKYLVSMGADIHLQNKKGETAYSLAVKDGKISAAEVSFLQTQSPENKTVNLALSVQQGDHFPYDRTVGEYNKGEYIPPPLQNELKSEPTPSQPKVEEVEEREILNLNFPIFTEVVHEPQKLPDQEPFSPSLPFGPITITHENYVSQSF